MLRLLAGSLAIALGVALCMVLVAPREARAQSLRHLVYTFTVGINSSQHDTTAANGISSMAAAGESNQILSSGDNAYNGEVSDKGEISLDIVGMRPDGGLVVTAHESAKERHERDDTCVVYASTNALCTDPATYQEIYAVIRTLSPKFYVGVALDQANHWRISDPKADVTIDFTAKPETDGTVDITSQRNARLKGVVSGTISATASYHYNPSKYVADSLKEYTTMHEQRGVGSYVDTTVDITAQLTSDSRTH